VKITRISIMTWSVCWAEVQFYWRLLRMRWSLRGDGSANSQLQCGTRERESDCMIAPQKFMARTMGLWFAVLFICFSVFTGSRAHGEKIYAPDWLWERGIAEKNEPTDIADAHLGIPYRDDGALDDQGRFTTFSDPRRFFGTPGLNCSGLVVSACRFLFDRNWTLEQVMRDPQGNSGPGSALGKDWDFGWDLILNLSEGSSRRPLMPDAGTHAVADFDGLNTRGFDLHDRAGWREVLRQMRPGRVYLGSISRLSRQPGYRVLHYHVVLMVPDNRGSVWLYHATRRSNVHRMDMSTPKGMSRFMSQFTGARDDGKRIIVLECSLPQVSSGSSSPQGSAASAKETEAMGPKRDEENKGPVPSAEPPVTSPQRSALAPGLPVIPESPTDAAEAPPAVAPGSPAVKGNVPERVINHLAGRVFKPVEGVTTAIPRFADDEKQSVRFWFRNTTPVPRNVQIALKGPDGEQRFEGKVGAEGSDLLVRYPPDFEQTSGRILKLGQYRADVKLDGVQWLTDVFEVAVPREAAPKILQVQAPTTVQAGKSFTVKIEAQNTGAESDYGGITVSTPASSGLRLKSAGTGRLYPPGSTVLSVTSDRIRTKVPMAERWIELWGENATYDLTVKIDAVRPGTYPLFIRCALRGVNVKSSVILMDPKSSESVDQQGFPVYVHNIKVQ
jgi:hypothetical protein